MEMGVGGVAPTDVGVLLSGIGIKVKDNTFTAIVKTPTTTPCIRTDGPLSQFEISDNTIKNYGTGVDLRTTIRSEEHTSELQSLMRISYAVFCLKKKTTN